jgi:hypothetical protein
MYGRYLMNIWCRMSANYFLRFSHTKRRQIDRSKHSEEEGKKRMSYFFLFIVIKLTPAQ